MYDIKWIRNNPTVFDAGLENRGMGAMSGKVLQMDEARRHHIQKVQDAQARRNAASKDIGKAKATGDEVKAQALIDEVAQLKSFLQTAEEEERRLNEELNVFLAQLPNAPLDDVPLGVDENDNVEVRQFGELREISGAKEHFELGEALGLMDFEGAAKLAGSRFVVLKGQLARLERALGQFMLDLHTKEHGYMEMSPPLLVRDEIVFGTGQLPKFSDDLFRTSDGRWLIPTAEVPLTNLVRDMIISEAELPMRFCALTPCFRSEAGSAGRDTRGMLRQHQFNKVELVAISKPEDSLIENEYMVACAEEVLKRLKLPYRVVLLSTGDLGFSARYTFDIEAWLPGQGCYREISSCSVCGDFQARRMNARFRRQVDKRLDYVHTLNGSGVAVGRALIAVMENYQNGDGSVTIPDVLRPYMGGMERIG